MNQPIKIAYVGKKQREDAFREETGIAWTPGLEQDVKHETAVKMLKHPDVFCRADEVTERRAELRAMDASSPRADGCVLVAVPKHLFDMAQAGGGIASVLSVDGYPVLLDMAEEHDAKSSRMAQRIAAMSGVGDDGIGTGDGMTGDGDKGIGQAEDFGGGDRPADLETGLDAATSVSLAPGAKIAPELPAKPAGKKHK